MRAGRAGFTLIELMIALAIMAVVAAIALPLYDRYVDRTYRAEAQADLMVCAQALERFAASHFDYAAAGAAFTAGELCDPVSQRNGRYTVTLAVAEDGGERYLLTATPTDPGPMAGDGFITFDDAGIRGWDRNGDGEVGADEWTWQE